MSTSLLSRITINAEIAHCKLTIRNKRYTVEGMLEYMAGGDSINDFALVGVPEAAPLHGVVTLQPQRRHR